MSAPENLFHEMTAADLLQSALDAIKEHLRESDVTAGLAITGSRICKDNCSLEHCLFEALLDRLKERSWIGKARNFITELLRREPAEREQAEGAA